MRSSLASIVLLKDIEPSFDVTSTPPKQSIVSDDNCDPGNFDNNEFTISLSLELVVMFTSFVPSVSVASERSVSINLE